jgi:hypothetical protein
MPNIFHIITDGYIVLKNNCTMGKKVLDYIPENVYPGK